MQAARSAEHAREVWVERERPLGQRHGGPQVVRGGITEDSRSPQVKVVGIEALRRLAQAALNLGIAHAGFDGSGDLYGHAVVKLEDVFDRAVEIVGPQVCTRQGIDELAP